MTHPLHDSMDLLCDARLGGDLVKKGSLLGDQHLLRGTEGRTLKVDARTATAKDFDKAADRHAHAFWLWLIVAGAVWYFVGRWWAAIPSAFALWCVVNSVGATIYAKKLREGTFPIPNPNNGKTDPQ